MTYIFFDPSRQFSAVTKYFENVLGTGPCESVIRIVSTVAMIDVLLGALITLTCQIKEGVPIIRGVGETFEIQ